MGLIDEVVTPLPWRAIALWPDEWGAARVVGAEADPRSVLL
jgi:hypothetical protein